MNCRVPMLLQFSVKTKLAALTLAVSSVVSIMGVQAAQAAVTSSRSGLSAQCANLFVSEPSPERVAYTIGEILESDREGTRAQAAYVTFIVDGYNRTQVQNPLFRTAPGSWNEPVQPLGFFGRTFESKKFDVIFRINRWKNRDGRNTVRVTFLGSRKELLEGNEAEARRNVRTSKSFARFLTALSGAIREMPIDDPLQSTVIIEAETSNRALSLEFERRGMVVKETVRSQDVQYGLEVEPLATWTGSMVLEEIRD